MATQNGQAPENDTSRAVSQKAYFPITLDRLVAIVEGYRQRTYNEDMMTLDKEGGPQGLMASLRTSLEKGLNGSDFAERAEQFGTNYKAPPKLTPYWRLFLNAMDDFMLKFLLVCAAVQISIEMGFSPPEKRNMAWIEGFAIFLGVLIVAGVGSWNDYQKEKQFLKLQAESDKENTIVSMRNGQETTINHNEIQVGDILKIKAGMNIPVDGIILRSSGVQANEAAMTGESDELKKDSQENCKARQEEKDAEYEYLKSNNKNPHDLPSPLLLSGTQIATGEGWFVCIVVGKHSCVGKILGKLEQRIETTPLQMKLEKIATDIGKLGMYCALLTIHVLFLRFFIENFIKRDLDLYGSEKLNDNKTYDGMLNDYLQEWLHYLIIGVAIVVVSVPEGLPLAVMISLAYSVKRMLIDKNFVKRLSSCEIMGGANNICSDKTGTLTMNKMTVTNIWAGRDLSVKVNDPQYYWKDYFNNDKHIHLLTQAICCNTSGSLKEASATEVAMLNFITKLGTDYEQVRQKHLPTNFTRFHFTSKRKRMSTLTENNGETEYGYDRRIHMKGAAEQVLTSCNFYLDADGQKKPLLDEMKQNLLKIITQMAGLALRTICFAYKDLQPNEGGPSHQDMDADGVLRQIEKKDFVVVCIFGIKDIIRPEVPTAVAQCMKAGITVRMVTGDNKITAMAIAKECKIIDESFGINSDSVLEGPEFYERMGGLICKTCKQDAPCNCDPKDVVEGVKNIRAFEGLWKNLRVLARSRPEDKYLLVTGLKEMGDVVAVTGDGTNDAPALKKADVGFAMGITGTDVAKHAADIIVMDDNFASIVKAVMWGRSVYDNIRKFLQFQLTVNVVAMFTAFVGSVILKETPLQPIQLLWINLIMDSFASLALATEPPTLELLDRPPYARDEYIVSRKMVKNLLGMSIYEIIVIYAIVFAGEHFFPEPEVQYRFGRDSPFLFPGRIQDWDGSDLYKQYEKTYGVSRHMTNVFNVFTVMQIFNLVNARKIHDELNVFKGIFSNYIFFIVFAGCFGGQAIIVELGGSAMKVSYAGLAGEHWAIAIGLGFSTWIAGFFIKFIPDTWCPAFGDKKQDPLQNEDSVLSLRKKRSSSYLRQGSQLNSKKDHSSQRQVGIN